jgi:hypothetical protein
MSLLEASWSVLSGWAEGLVVCNNSLSRKAQYQPRRPTKEVKAKAPMTAPIMIFTPKALDVVAVPEAVGDTVG